MSSGGIRPPRGPDERRAFRRAARALHVESAAAWIATRAVKLRPGGRLTVTRRPPDEPPPFDVTVEEPPADE